MNSATTTLESNLSEPEEPAVVASGEMGESLGRVTAGDRSKPVFPGRSRAITGVLACTTLGLVGPRAGMVVVALVTSILGWRTLGCRCPRS